MSDFDTEIGKRVRDLRERLGITQEELAENAGFPAAQTISEIEKGKRKIKLSELSELAKSLHVDSNDIIYELEKQNSEIIWRERTKSNDEEIEANFIHYLKRYKHLEEITEFYPQRDLTSVIIDDSYLDYNNVRDLAIKIRDDLNLGKIPARNLFEVLDEEFGIKFWFDELSDIGSGASVCGDFGFGILLNRDEAPWRINFTLAHELFHLITPNVVEISDKNITPCKLANVFASNLLLPHDQIIGELERLGENDDIYRFLVDISRKFKVSTSALLYRLIYIKEINIDKDQVEKILNDEEFRNIDKQSILGRWYHLPEFPERFVRLAFKALVMGRISRNKLSNYFRVPLSELNYKFREYGYNEEEHFEIA